MNPLHYPSLELCKKLKEIGFPETHMCHMLYDDGRIGNIYSKIEPNDKKRMRVLCPSVMEMLDVIPKEIHISLEKDWLIRLGPYEEEKELTGEYNYLCAAMGEKVTKDFIERSIPNALASMIIWLYENKFISFGKQAWKGFL